MSLPRIAVLIGTSPSSQSASQATAAQILATIDARQHLAQPVLVTPSGDWRLYHSALGFNADTPIDVIPAAAVPERLPYLFEAAFIALHGVGGEDGEIQRLLDRAGVPYQGTGPRASARAFDKAETNQYLRRMGVAIPDYIALSRAEWVATRGLKLRQILHALGPDLVIKPTKAATSEGVFLVRTAAELADAIEQVSVRYDRFIVQRHITGTELACVVVETADGPIPLPPVHIEPRRSRILDRSSRQEHGAVFTAPAPFSAPTQAALGQLALRVHKSLALRDYSQIELVLTRQRAWVIDVDTLPELGEHTPFPHAVAAHGWTIADTTRHLVDRALARPAVIELH